MRTANDGSAARISVALCTYNGATHLAEQLRSIEAQTSLPSELVVCDDTSTDATLAILQEFARDASFPVHIHTNTENIGSTRNFDRAISLCRGDLILLCDQDDVWETGKIARFIELFATHSEAEGIFSNASVRSGDASTATDLWSFIGITAGEKEHIGRGNLADVFLAHGNLVFGTTFGFRADVRRLVTPIPSPLPGITLHDGWIALALALRGTLRGFDEKLSVYRQHEKQQVGLSECAAPTLLQRLRRGRSDRARIFSSEARILRELRHLLENAIGSNEINFEPLDSRIRHLEFRASLPQHATRRLRAVFAELAQRGYQRHSGNSLAAPLRDFFG